VGQKGKKTKTRGQNAKASIGKDEQLSEGCQQTENKESARQNPGNQRSQEPRKKSWERREGKMEQFPTREKTNWSVRREQVGEYEFNYQGL